jgi:2Fe-2S ferredoxin
MTKITIVAFDGTRFDVDAENGSTVMENAIRNSVPGIEAECGGACACATCHVHVAPDWLDKLPAPRDDEQEMLDHEAIAPTPTSRLSCQLLWTPALDGLVVELAGE